VRALQMTDLLGVNGLTKRFGQVVALKDVSFAVSAGEILGVIGPNGAGKTTLFNLISGLLTADQGSIALESTDITHLSATKRCRLGIGRTYQIPRPFSGMTVSENLRVAATHGANLSGKAAADLVEELMETTALGAKKDLLAGRLTFVDRKRLELARALAGRPKVVLVDEIAGGLGEEQDEGIVAVLRGAARSGVTIVWTEHLTTLLSREANRLLLLDAGAVVHCADPDQVTCSREFQRAYLGVEA
jgi:branched-chain amino acid transport system ATP-binding protein